MTDRDDAATERLWLVERTYSDDEQNVIILVYATLDGRQYLRKERALTSFEDHRETTAAIDVDAQSLGTVHDESTRARYAAAAREMEESHSPEDLV
jgi:hypothetical protein